MGERKHTDIKVRGKTYATARDAAKDLGVQYNTVLAAIRRGKLDTLGIGQGRHQPMPISIRGKVYRDAKVAARAHGVTVNVIYSALYQGAIDRVGLPRCGGSRSKPFSIGGLNWPSRRAASIELGFPEYFVAQAVLHNRKGAMRKIYAAAMKLEAERCRGRGRAGLEQ